MGRYAIYEALGKNIEFKQKGETVCGTCEAVKREVLENNILFRVNGKDYCFAEPHKIDLVEDQIVFVYGSEQKEDMVAFCGEEFSVHWGEDIRKSIGREMSFIRMVFTIK